MAENSGISWTDHTFNPWMGCTKVSPACKNCYAERDMDHRFDKVAWGPNGTRVKTSPANWMKPVYYNKNAISRGNRTRVFCASLADVFEEWDGPIHDHKGNILTNATAETAGPNSRRLTMDDLRKDLFELIDATPNLDWLLLTKRPENIAKMWPRRSDYQYIPEAGLLNEYPMHHRPNVWLGTTVENQEWADKRIPALLQCRDLPAKLFLSMEPLFGFVDIRPPLWLEDSYFKLRRPNFERGLDWVIAGGESGPDARECHPDWFRWLRDQCAAAGVPFHFKQWGEWLPDTQNPKMDTSSLPRDCTFAIKVGTKNSGRLLDGVLHDAFPESEVPS